MNTSYHLPECTTTFQYVHSSIIREISPTSGSVQGGTRITVSGLHFSDNSLSCVFDGVKAPAMVLNSTSLLCDTPAHPGTQVVSFDLVDDNGFARVDGDQQFQFEYVESSEIVAVRPNIIVLTSNKEILEEEYERTKSIFVTATNLVGNLQNIACRFADHEETQITFESPATRTGHNETHQNLTCDVPIELQDVTNSFTLTLVSKSNRMSLNGVTLRVHRPIVLLSVEPQIIPSSSGGRIRVSGTSFVNSDTPYCRFEHVSSLNSKITQASWLSTSLITCDAPTMRPGKVRVSVGYNGVDWSSSSQNVMYTKEPDVIGIVPSRGSTSGGTHVRVSGAGFDSFRSMWCAFGTHRVPAVVYEHGVTCVSPRYSSNETVRLGIMSEGRDLISSQEIEFVYDTGLLVEKVEPSMGYASGGNTITVHGEGFFSSSSAPVDCMFGSRSVRAQVLSDTSLTCVSPNVGNTQSTEKFSVVRSTNEGDIVESSNTLEFSFLTAPLTYAVVPSYGSASGDTPVIVLGALMSPHVNLVCEFGTKRVDAKWLNASAVRCNTVKSALGTVNVRVAVKDIPFNNNEALSLQTHYTFVPRPTAYQIRPTLGSTRGGTQIYVMGSNFFASPTLTCSFGDLTTSPALVMNRSCVTCFTPSSSSSSSEVQVSLLVDGTNYTNEELSFRYVVDATIHHLEPTSGPSGGGTAVSVVGENFRMGSMETLCRFGDVVVNADVIDETTVLCASSPAVSFKGTVDFDVQFDGSLKTSNSKFLYYQSPRIAWVEPSKGSEHGGTVVTIRGTGFRQTEDLRCKFDSAVVMSEWIDSTTVQCETPSHAIGDVELSVSNNAMNFDASIVFKYETLMEPLSIYPSRGSSTGGTIVTLTGSNFRFSSELKCRFDSKVVPAKFTTFSNEISCVTPNSDSLKIAQVSISSNNHDFSKSSLSYEYIRPVVVTRVYPLQGPSYGGTKITILGLNFQETSQKCIFGETEVTPSEFVSSSEIVCSAPSNPGVGVVTLSVTDCSDHFDFEYVESETFVNLKPTRGTFSGGETVIVRGLDFSSFVSYTCHFGLVVDAVPASFLSTTELLCVTPSHPIGSVNFVLRSSNNFKIGETSFTFSSSVTLLSVSPSSGTSGTSVVVQGHGFEDTANSKCRFGDITTRAVRFNRTHLICTAPSMTEYGEVLVAVTMNGKNYTSEELTFRYVRDATIHRLEPTSGPSGGGTAVRVLGENFRLGVKTTCRFGDIVLEADVIDETTILCASTPAVMFKGVIDVKVQFDDGMHTPTSQFLYYEPSQIEWIEPSTGSEHGGTVVTIRGTGFRQTEDLRCKFDSVVVMSEWIDSTTVHCKTPSHAIGHVDLSISNNAIDFGANISFQYETLMEPRSIYPSRGPTTGGTIVTLTGSNFRFSPELTCRFDAEVVPAVFDSSSNQVSCVVPVSDSLKTVRVFISSNGHDFSKENSELLYEYTHPVVVTKVQPSQGPSHGGTKITIFGSNFKETSTRCMFGKTQVTPSEFVSSNEIVCVAPLIQSPEFQDGTVTVRVSINDGADFSTNPVRFLTYQGVNIYALTPHRGLDVGNTLVTVHGSNFTAYAKDGVRCEFGDETSIARVLSSTLLECTAPAITTNVSKVLFRVVGISGESLASKNDDASNTLHFEYYSLPQIKQITPSFGPHQGGTIVTVDGNHFTFSEDLRCNFGDLSSSVIYRSANRLECEAPPSSSDPLKNNNNVTFSVTTNGADRTEPTSTSLFQYTSLHEIHDVTPSQGPSRGGTSALVRGNFGTLSSLVLCKFGDNVVDGVYISETEVSCVSPSFVDRNGDYETGVVILSVALNGQDFSKNLVKFVYVSHPEIVQLFPQSVSSEGGVHITVKGRNFMDSENLKCRFDDTHVVSATWVSRNEMVCGAMPSFVQSGHRVSLEVSNNGVEYTQSTELYVLKRWWISSVEPSKGPASGNNVVINIHGENFVPDVEDSWMCRFGDSNLIRAFWISSSTLRCVLPPHRPGVVSVKVTPNAMEFSNSAGDTEHFEYYAMPSVESVQPTFGTHLGGTRVTIRGQNLHNMVSTCHFGPSHSALAEDIVDDTIVCLSPPLLNGEDDIVSLSLSSSEGIQSEAIQYTYTARPVAVSLYPRKIAGANHATFVYVRGSHFIDTSSLSCKFENDSDEIVTQCMWLSRDLMRCPTQDLTPGNSYLASVSNNGHDFYRDEEIAVHLDVDYALVVRDVSPSFGESSGGTTILVRAFDLPASANAPYFCRFGELVVSGLRVSQDTVRCVSPALKQDSYVLTLTQSAQTHVLFQDIDEGVEFIVCDSPGLESVMPSSGPERGGTVVIVKGSGFSSSCNFEPICRFGQEVTSATILNDTHVTCISPENSFSNTSLLSSLESGLELQRNVEFAISIFEKSNDDVLEFAYYPEPILSNIFPSTVYGLNEGAVLTVRGSNFMNVPDLRCKLNKQEVSARFLSVDRVECELGKDSSQQEETIQVFVSLNSGVDYSSTSVTLNIRRSLSVLELRPTSGPSRGGSIVRAFVRGLQHISRTSTSLFCRFGYSTSRATYESNSTIRCVSPPHIHGNVSFAVSANGEQSLVSLSDEDDKVVFEYIAQHTNVAMTISPTRGSIAGGTMIWVRSVYKNQHLYPDVNNLQCQFGEIREIAHRVNSTTVLCVSPKSPQDAGMTAFSLVDNANHEIKSGLQFEYSAIPQVTSVRPSFGSEEGGTHIRVNGIGFLSTDKLTCRFDNVVVFATWRSEFELECKTPIMGESRNVFVEISNDNSEFSEKTAVFEYRPRPKLMSWSPTRGSYRGGTVVEMYGRDFEMTSLLRCRFGEIVVPASYVNATMMKCVSPSQQNIHSEVQMFVSNNARDYYSSTTTTTFRYVGDTTATDLLPKIGYLEGGNTLFVRGQGFVDSDMTTCRLGHSVVKATVDDETQIRCVVPASNVSARVPVEISQNGQEYVDSGLRYEYVPKIRILQVTPDTGSSGTTLTLRGEHFVDTPELSCRFDQDQNIIAMFNSETEIECVVPSLGYVHTTDVQVDVTINNQDYSNFPQNFVYLRTVAVSHISPVSGTERGGTVVSLYGVGLRAGMMCRFGTQNVVAVFFNNTVSHLECVSPENALVTSEVSAVRVSISSNGVDFVDTGRDFTYRRERHEIEEEDDGTIIAVSRIDPSAGSAAGGSLVNVYGSGFMNVEGLSCQFGSALVPASFRSENHVTCYAPRHSPAVVYVEVGNKETKILNVVSNIKFEYRQEPEVYDVTPSMGPARGGTLVTISGASFVESGTLTCRFGVAVVPVRQFLSSNQIVCAAPEATQNWLPHAIQIEVSNNNRTFSQNRETFTYHRPALLADISPTFGSTDGGTVVFIKGANFLSSGSKSSRQEWPSRHYALGLSNSNHPRLRDEEDLKCRFGETIVSAQVLTSNEVRCVSPPHTEVGVVRVQVSMNGVDFEISHLTFEYVAKFVVLVIALSLTYLLTF